MAYAIINQITYITQQFVYYANCCANRDIVQCRQYFLIVLHSCMVYFDGLQNIRGIFDACLITYKIKITKNAVQTTLQFIEDENVRIKKSHEAALQLLTWHLRR